MGEAHNGILRQYRTLFEAGKTIRMLDCEAYTPSKNESWF